MKSTGCSGVIDGFQLKLRLNEDYLQIEAVSLTNNTMYNLDLSNEQIAGANLEWFGDTDSLYQGLEEAFQSIDKTTSLHFDINGELSYFKKIDNEKMEKCFQIQLIEKKPIEPMDLVNSQMKRMMEKFEATVGTKLKELENKMTKFETKKNKLISENQNSVLPSMTITEKLQAFEQKITSLEAQKTSHETEDKSNKDSESV